MVACTIILALGKHKNRCNFYNPEMWQRSRIFEVISSSSIVLGLLGPLLERDITNRTSLKIRRDGLTKSVSNDFSRLETQG